MGPLQSPLPPLTSVYVRAHGKEPELTTRVSDFEGTIDFIFVRYCGGEDARTYMHVHGHIHARKCH